MTEHIDAVLTPARVPEEESLPLPASPKEQPENPAPADPSALLAELDALRAEQRLRALQEQAEAALIERGLPRGFATFLLGEDGDATLRQVERFEALFREALRAQRKIDFQSAQPRDFSAAPRPARRRGIHRV